MSEEENQAIKVVKKYMWWSVGSALLPIPIVDMFVLVGFQLKMLAEISRIYQVQFQKSRGKAAVGSLLGGSLPNLTVGICVNYLDFILGGAIASLMKAVPLMDAAIAVPVAVLSGAATWALGKTFILHFESGGTVLDFKSEQVREYFKAQFEEGRKMAASMNAGGKGEVQARTSKVQT